MKKIRVLQFAVVATAGGGTRYILNLWKHINKEQFQFDFVTFSKKLPYENELLQSGARVFYIDKYPETDEELFVTEFTEILKNGYDVIHIATSSWKNTIVEKTAKICGIKRIIIHSHSSGLEPRRMEYEDALRLHFQIKNEIDETIATDFWACSHAAAEWLYGDRINSNRIEIVSNGVDIDRFDFNASVRESVRNELNLKEKFVVGFCGRLEKVKNVEYIIDIFVELKKLVNYASLLLVGDGSLRTELELLAADRLNEEDYLFIGSTEVPENYLQAMDVLLLPSLFEGSPLVLIESQSMGLHSIISTNVPSDGIVTDLVQCLELEQKEKWLDSLVKLAKGYLRNSYSMVIKKHGFDIGSTVKRIERLYIGDEE